MNINNLRNKHNNALSMQIELNAKLNQNIS